MAYQPTDWKNREVERPRTFTFQENDDGTVTLIPAEGKVTEPGTPIMAVNMNKIENQLVLHDTSIEKLINNTMNAINAGANTQDPDVASDSYIVTNHDNSPVKGIYWHILTFFYASKTSNRAQIAVSYNGTATRMFIRHMFNNWYPWVEVVTSKLPTPVKAVLTAGWTSVSGSELEYYKDQFGVVHVEGVVSKGDGAGSPLTTLPVGYRPLRRHIFNYELGYEIHVLQDGQIIVGGSNGRRSVYISFRTT